MTTIVVSLWLAGLIAVDTGVQMVSMQGSVSRYAAGLTEAEAIEKPGIFQIGDRVILVDDATLRLGGPDRIDLIGSGEISMVKQNRYRWAGQGAYIEAGERTVFFDIGRFSLHVRDSRVRMRRQDKGFVIEVLGGKKAAVFVPGKLVTVGPGYGIFVDEEGNPGGLVPLPAGPTAIAPESGRSLRSFRFAWRPIEGAESYRFELAKDETFRDILYSDEVSATTHRNDNRSLPIGTLYWRVTAKGRNGFMGVPSPAQAIRIEP